MKLLGVLLTGALLTAGGTAWSHQQNDQPKNDQPSDEPEKAAPASTTQEDAPSASSEPYRDDEQRTISGDPALRGRVQSAIDKQPVLKNQPIGVTLSHCRADADDPDATRPRCNVILTGTVDTQMERATAERAARVRGVVLIDNQLELTDKKPSAAPVSAPPPSDKRE
jgi:hypothetical protein